MYMPYTHVDGAGLQQHKSMDFAKPFIASPQISPVETQSFAHFGTAPVCDLANKVSGAKSCRTSKAAF